MSAALLSLLAVALLALGVRMTILLATRVPGDALAVAQQHGRFAGLGAAQRDTGAGRPRSARPATPAVAPQLARA